MSVEFALTLPAVVLILGAVMALVAWGADAVAVSSTASAAARAAAVDGEAAAHEIVHRMAPRASVDVRIDDAWATVTVTAPSRGWTPHAQTTAVARRERAWP